jgi:hypothetical protein
LKILTNKQLGNSHKNGRSTHKNWGLLSIKKEIGPNKVTITYQKRESKQNKKAIHPAKKIEFQEPRVEMLIGHKKP